MKRHVARRGRPVEAQRAAAAFIEAQASHIKRAIDGEIARGGVRARINLDRHAITQTDHLDIWINGRPGSGGGTPQTGAIDVEYADAGQAGAVLPDSRRRRQEADLAAGIVILPAGEVEAVGRTRAVPVDGHGGVGIASSRGVANPQRPIWPDHVWRVAGPALDLEQAGINNGRTAVAVGVAQHHRARAILRQAIGAGDRAGTAQGVALAAVVKGHGQRCYRLVQRHGRCAGGGVIEEHAVARHRRFLVGGALPTGEPVGRAADVP